MVYTGSGFLIPALQVSNQGSASISVLAATSGLVSDIGFGYGTDAMTWTFTQTTATSVTVTANDRDGSGSYSQTFAVNGALSGFGLFAGAFSDGNGNREPYYNNFTITAVPGPGALALLGVAGIVGARRRR
jgi:MYXO-CTERM domain-containing protein